MKPLRILVVADMKPDRNSGAPGSEMEVADELERQGHEVVRRWADAFPHRIRHWNLYHLLEQPRAMAAVVERETTKCEFDVIQVAQPAGWLAAREHRCARRPGLFVHRSHGYEPRVGAVVERWSRVYSEDRRPFRRRIGSALLARLLERNYRGIEFWADAHVVSCSECADELVRRGVPRPKILNAPQAASDDLLTRPLVDFDLRRARRILYVSQHAFFKGPMIAAQVLERVFASDSDLEATWICQPTELDAVRARFGPLGRTRVSLEGWRPRAELPELFDAHGIFLFTSFTEGFGKIFLEAMARGLAVVSTDQGGARDLIESGRNGLLAPVGDVDALSRSVLSLVRNVDRAARIGAEARTTAGSLSWEGTVRRTAEFWLERLAAQRNS